VEVESSDAALWRPEQRFSARASGVRYSPAVHVNQAGYLPALPKGDYSKYTINSAALIHSLIFAVDAFEGAGDLDNLGLPESGDGGHGGGGRGARANGLVAPYEARLPARRRALSEKGMGRLAISEEGDRRARP